MPTWSRWRCWSRSRTHSSVAPTLIEPAPCDDDTERIQRQIFVATGRWSGDDEPSIETIQARFFKLAYNAASDPILGDRVRPSRLMHPRHLDRFRQSMSQQEVDKRVRAIIKFTEAHRRQAARFRSRQIALSRQARPQIIRRGSQPVRVSAIVLRTHCVA